MQPDRTPSAAWRRSLRRLSPSRFRLMLLRRRAARIEREWEAESRV